MTTSILTTCKRFLLSRTTMLTLLVALLASVLVASLVPQSFLTTEPEMLRWRDEYRGVALVSGRLGLHHVFTSWWFTAILLCSLLSMTLSAIEQGRQAWRKTFTVAVAEGGTGIAVESVASVAAAARAAGYLQVAEGSRYVRHPWGYWGNFLLHLGLVVTVASSLLISLTQQRGSLVMIKGEPHHADEPWGMEENGFLAGKLVFPYSVKLLKVDPEFLPIGKVRQIRSELKIADAAGAEAVRQVAVNAMLSHAGVHVYQSTDFGHAFRVNFTASDGEVHHFTIPVYHPQSLVDAGYRDLRLPISPARLEAKYFVDEERKSLMQGRPVLTLRLMEDLREIGRVTLRPGDAGQLGPFPVRLVEVTEWTELIFVRITGMPGVFTGFALIILGTIFTYCLPPREFRLSRQGEGGLLSWRAERFAGFYADERDAVFSRVRKERK